MSTPLQPHTVPPPAPQIDFGWLVQAWALFSAQAGVWIGTLLLWFFLEIAVWVLLAIPTGVLASMRAIYTLLLTHPGTSPRPSASPYQNFAQTELFSILLAGISAIFAGGLYRMALRQLRGEPISAGNLFSALPQSLPLLLVGIFIPAVLGLLEGAGLWLMHFSLSPTAAVSVINITAWLPALLLPGLVMFAPLLVVDAGASAPAALVGSVRLLGRQWLMGILFYVVAALVSGLGAIACGVGMLATYPLLFLSITLGYLVLTHSVPLGERPPEAPLPGVWPPPPSAGFNAPAPPQWGSTPVSPPQYSPPQSAEPRRSLSGDPLNTPDQNTPGQTPPGQGE